MISGFVPGPVGATVVMLAFVIAIPAAAFDLHRVRRTLATQSANDDTVKHSGCGTLKYEVLCKADMFELRIVESMLLEVLMIYLAGAVIFGGLAIAFSACFCLNKV
jgi:hypothetical protein